MSGHPGRRGRRAPGAPVLLLVLALLAAACTAPRDGSASRPPSSRSTHQPCRGVHLDDVRGPRPSYVDGPLATFPNHSAVCRALWLPTADRWFVPQGLALDGRTAWVSGYRWHRDLGRRACRLLHVSLRTGRLLASTNRIAAEVYGAYPTFCRHGGGLSLDRHGLWLVESSRLWLLDPHRVGDPGQVRRVWRLSPAVRGSVLVGGTHGELGVGAWRDRGPGAMRWFAKAGLLAPGVEEVVAGVTPHAGQAGPLRTTRTVRRAQGMTSGPGGVWSSASTTWCGALVTPGGRAVSLAPGAEGIELDGHGGLWAVLESGARNYARAGRPVVPMLAQFDVRRLLDGERPGCGWR